VPGGDFVRALLKDALQAREELLSRLHDEKTSLLPPFHGTTEGKPGLTIDRYGPLVLVQTFRDPLPQAERESLETELRSALTFPFEFVYNHRGKKAGESSTEWHEPRPRL